MIFQMEFFVFFCWNLWKTDVWYRFESEWRSFFHSRQVDEGNERGEWATLSWPFRHVWRHMTPDTTQRSRAKANRVQMIWTELVDNVSQSGEGRKRKWNFVKQRNKSFDQCGFLKVSFSADWRYEHLNMDLWTCRTLHLNCKIKMRIKIRGDVNKESNKTK